MPAFERLIVWQDAREIARDVYRLVRESGLARDFGLRDQIQRAVVSIASNIVEGAERDNSKEFANFLRIAKASAAEVRAQLMIAGDVGLCPTASVESMTARLIRLGRMIAALIDRIRQS